jgi:hypothetical protein
MVWLRRLRLMGHDALASFPPSASWISQPPCAAREARLGGSSSGDLARAGIQDGGMEDGYLQMWKGVSL